MENKFEEVKENKFKEEVKEKKSLEKVFVSAKAVGRKATQLVQEAGIAEWAVV